MDTANCLTKDEVIHCCTIDYLENLDPKNLPNTVQIKNDLIQATRDEFSLHNATADKDAKWSVPDDLFPYQIALIIAYVEPVCCIDCVGNGGNQENDLLGVYQDHGPLTGLYAVDEISLSKLIRRYSRTIPSHQVDEVIIMLRELVPHRQRTHDKDLIAVNNGIFDFSRKVLMPFSADYIFLSKSAVNYVPAPINPVIHNPDDNTDWDIETWMNELSDDPDIVKLLWEVMSAIIRHNVRWDKSVWFYSTTGNNGKGTLCELLRQLCGPNSYASISLSDFSKDFLLEPLVHVNAIITDENNVGEFIDKAANLKAITTGDVIQINRKYKQPITYRFTGFMVQCLNEMPRVKDRSDSFYRRQLFIPFDHCFTGKERKYIKSDYLHRADVLEYVLHKILHMDIYTLSEPARCKEALDEYKEFNDPVRQFAEEMLPLCCWDLLPFSFLYDLYRSWMKRNIPSGGVQSRITFANDLLAILPSIPGWECPGRRKAIRPQGKMDWPEPLIEEYGLETWSNPTKSTKNSNNYNMPLLRATYNGILRLGKSMAPPGYGKNPAPGNDDDDEDDD